MKVTSLAVVLTAVTALITGCATSGYEAGTKTGTNIQKAADKIAALSEQVDASLVALNDLVGKPQPDLRPQYKTFASSVSALEKHAKEVTDLRIAMGEKGKQFFAKWDAELAKINNEDIKARSEARKQEVEQKLQAIKRSYAEVEVAFRPFMADLRDVQRFLSVDLTTGGLASIRDVAGKATEHAVPLKQSLNQLAADFKALGISMSAVTPAPAPAK